MSTNISKIITSSPKEGTRANVRRSRGIHDFDQIGAAVTKIMAAVEGLSVKDRSAAFKAAGAVYGLSVDWSSGPIAPKESKTPPKVTKPIRATPVIQQSVAVEAKKLKVSLPKVSEEEFPPLPKRSQSMTAIPTASAVSPTPSPLEKTSPSPKKQASPVDLALMNRIANLARQIQLGGGRLKLGQWHPLVIEYDRLKRRPGTPRIGRAPEPI